MSIRHPFLVLFFVAAAVSTSVAQLVKPNPANQVKLQKASEIHQSIVSFRDPKLSAYSQAQVADIAWKLDEAYARSIFGFALNLLEPDGRDKGREAYDKAVERRKVVALIARHDPKWAKTLLTGAKDKKKPDSDASAEAQTAADLLDSNEKAAVEIANESVNTAITFTLIDFLKRLRQQNPAEANALFLTTLTRFSSQPGGKAEMLGHLGTYLFTAPNIPPDEPFTIAITRVGNIMMPNISVDRPGITSAHVAPYLRTVTTLLTRPTADANERSVRYALGYLALPKAQVFAPGLSAELMAAMAAMSTTVDPQLNQASAYDYIHKTPSPPAERFKEIEKLADSAARDTLYLEMAFMAVRRKDLATAREAADKIDNKDFTEPLDIVLDFHEANTSLDSPDLDLLEADRPIMKMADSPEKALLWLRFAGIAAKAKNPRTELDALTSARDLTARLPEAIAPYLLVHISGRMKERGDLDAEQAFFEAVKLFNISETAGQPGFRRTIGRAPAQYRFPIEIKDVKIDFPASIRKLYAGAEDKGILAVADLKDEKLRAAAYMALLRSFLDRPTPAKPDIKSTH